MKKITLKFSILFLAVLLSGTAVIAQGDMLSREEKLVGSTSDFLIGLHTGIYDCNQTNKYPYNIGVMAQYNYTPDVMKNWFMGAEFGAFFAKSSVDDNMRELGAMIGHLSLYPGISFILDKKEVPEEADFKERLNSKKLNIAAGVTLGLPLSTSSSGPTYAQENAKTGFGFTGMVSFELPSRINLFGSVTFINADTDGFGYDPVSGDRTPGNDYQASWWYKLGVAYNLMGR